MTIFAKWQNKLLFLITLFYFLISGLPVQALYYAEPEFGYSYAGYTLVNIPEAKLGLCGVNFISADTVLTAAHCVQDQQGLFVGIGEYTANQGTSNIQSVFASPRYANNTSLLNAGMGDLAIVKLQEDFPLPAYAQISSPDIGCDYYIVGYGRNEKDTRYEREGLTTCIQKVNKESLLVTFPGKGFFCVGDSGSGLYRKGTNELVGLVSAFNYTVDCTDSTAFFVTRLDANLDFMDLHINTDYKSDNLQVISPNDLDNEDELPTPQDQDSGNTSNDSVLSDRQKSVLSETFWWFLVVVSSVGALLLVMIPLGIVLIIRLSKKL